MKCPTPTFLLCVGILLISSASSWPSVFGDKKNAFDERKIALFESAPPIPAPVKATLSSRAVVRIILRIKGLPQEPVTFSLRSEPEFGSAKLLPQVSQEWAEVEYTPPQDRSITTDSFKFVASNSRGSSSESTAVITIKDVGPRLEIPHRLDFGVLQTGQSRQLPLEVRNSGDYVAQGTISVSGEWILPGGTTSFDIAPGQSASFPVRISPTTAGRLEGEVLFHSGTLQSVYLLAKVEDWIHATPDPLLLGTQTPPQRGAMLTLTNETDSRQWVQIHSEPAISHPYGIWMDAKQTRRVPIICSDAGPAEKFGKLTLLGSDGRRRVVLWYTSPLGPALGGVEDLRSVFIPPSGKMLKLWNEGGRPGKWSLQVFEPFKIHLPNAAPSNLAEINLAPGASTQINLSYASKTPPKQDGTLQIRMVRHPLLSGNTLYSIALTTKRAMPYGLMEPREPDPSLQTTDAPHPAAAPRAAASKAGSNASKHLSLASVSEPDIIESPPPANTILPPDAVAQTRGSPEMNARVVGNLTTAFLPGLLTNEITVSHITWHSVRLTFPPPQGINPEQFVVRTRSMELTPSLELRTVWRPHSQFSAKRNKSGMFEINVDGLPPNASVGIMISGPRLKDNLSLVYKNVDINTLAQPHWLSPQRPWIWVLGVPLAFLAFLQLRWRRFR